VFHFDIQKNYFYCALDRFAQFFIEPLMRKDSVDRELEAIDSGNCDCFSVVVIITIILNNVKMFFVVLLLSHFGFNQSLSSPK